MLQPLLIDFARDNGWPLGEARFKPLASLAGQFLRLIAPFGCGKARQDRCAHQRAHRTTSGNVHAIGQRLGQVRKEGDHFGFTAEAMIGRHTLAFVIGHAGGLADAHQNILGPMPLWAVKAHVIGRHQRKIALIS